MGTGYECFGHDSCAATLLNAFLIRQIGVMSSTLFIPHLVLWLAFFPFWVTSFFAVKKLLILAVISMSTNEGTHRISCICFLALKLHLKAVSILRGGVDYELQAAVLHYYRGRTYHFSMIDNFYNALPCR